jgi:predicted ATP-grasp superfamily ATP-dependent carboligase
MKLAALFHPIIPKLFISFHHFEAELTAELDTCKFVSWDEVAVENGILTVAKEPITKFGFIFMGPVTENQVKASVIRDYIKKYSVPHLYYGVPAYLENKPLQSFLFSQNDIAQPKTIISHTSNIDAEKLVKELKLPIIAKITNGSQGKGISKLDTNAAVVRFLKANPKQEFIFQEFIPNSCDYRIFFFKNELLYAIKRERKKESKEFRNNLSLGATQEFVELPENVKILAKKIACCFELDFAGVDLVQSEKDGTWFVFEINSAPQFISKENLVLPKIIQYIKSN